MSFSENQITISGRLTRDPEMKYLPSGKGVTSIGFVHNARVQKNGEWVDEPLFLDLTCWDKLAERMAHDGKKGDRVYVRGTLKRESWEKDGVKHSKLKINASTIQFLDRKEKGESAAPEPRASDNLAFSNTPAADDDFAF